MEFKQLTSSVDELQKALDALPSHSERTAAQVVSIVDNYASLVEPRLARFVARAKETDPDRKIFGPAMVSKIFDLATRVEAQVHPRVQALMDDRNAMAAAEAKHVADEAAATKKAEEEAQLEAQRQREAAAARAAEERAHKEEEARRASEEARRAAELLKRMQDAKKAEKEALKKGKEESEKRIKEEAAAKVAAQRAAEAEARAVAHKAKIEELQRAARAAQAPPAKPAPAAPAAAAAPAAPVTPARAPAATAAAAPAHTPVAATRSSSALPFKFGEVSAIHSSADFEAALSGAGDSVVVVDFHAQWCGPCRGECEAGIPRPAASCFIIDERENALTHKSSDPHPKSFFSPALSQPSRPSWCP